jgi:hypothetical protein
MNANVTLRAATIDDCRAVAELFRIASDGVSDYILSTFTDEYPGLSLIEIDTMPHPMIHHTGDLLLMTTPVQT